jgi:hypothetical protein
LPTLAPWFAEFKEKVEAWMTRKTNRMTDVRLYIDEHGSWIVVCFDHPMSMTNAKTAIESLQAHTIPPEAILGKPAQLRANLHPFDELDKERLEVMQPITGFRRLVLDFAPKEPKFEVRQVPGSSGDRCSDYYERQLPSSDSEDENALAITPAATLAVLAIVGPVTMSLEDRRAKRQRTNLAISDRSVKDDAQEDWAESVRETVAVAVIIGANVIEYIRCTHEDRRQKILAKRLDSHSTPFSTVMAAHTLASKDVFPGYMQKQSCKNDMFLGRCAAALAMATGEALIDKNVFKKYADISTCKVCSRKLCTEQSLKDGFCLEPRRCRFEFEWHHGGLCMNKGCVGKPREFKGVDMRVFYNEEPKIMQTCCHCGWPFYFGRNILHPSDLFTNDR